MGKTHKMPQFKGLKPAPGSTPAAPINDLPAPGASTAGGAGGTSVRSHKTRQDTGSRRMTH